MRVSQSFWRTLREAPAEADTEVYRLILRAGLARQVAAGIFSYLPLGWRVIRKIESILREEMDSIGGQEIRMPVLVPADLWKESGRWFSLDQSLWRIEDRNHRPFVLAMTHEEVASDIVRHDLRSYRQLPFLLYQIQTKVRDEPRPRGGLVRMREFLMKDAYSFHADAADLDRFYPCVYQAYINIYRRVGVPVVAIQADPGMIGGTGSHEFVARSELGETTIIRCTSCQYIASQEVAVARRPAFFTDIAAAAPPPQPVHTPGVTSIEALEHVFGLPPDAFLKTVVYSADGNLVAVILSGGVEVNELKLGRLLGATRLRLATNDELAAAGLTPGFVSPVGLRDIRLIIDESVAAHPYIAGANRPDYHLRNVLPGRDFPVTARADVATVRGGEACILCGSALVEETGLELGHTFKLGTRYSEAMGIRYLGPDGREAMVVMGCYGIGLDRLFTAIVDSNHDEKGIIWPAAVAPYSVYLLGLGLDRPEVLEAANRLYEGLHRRGIEVFFDDRPESPGVKFADADLLGLPLRLTISPRTIRQGAAEVTIRRTGETTLVSLDDVVEHVARHPVVTGST
ncbi:MAG: proline--tRNA ligase [Chloroflexi bacterium]|nr:proline--tRNA ligase [Chloroflexota bacterium]